MNERGRKLDDIIEQYLTPQPPEEHDAHVAPAIRRTATQQDIAQGVARIRHGHEPANGRGHVLSLIHIWVAAQVKKANWSLDVCAGYAKKHNAVSYTHLMAAGKSLIWIFSIKGRP